MGESLSYRAQRNGHTGRLHRVTAPPPDAGVASALRAAFQPPSGTGDDLRRLLSMLD